MSLLFQRMSIVVVAMVAILLSYNAVVLVHGLSSPLPSPKSNQYGDTTRNIATHTLQGAGPASVDMNMYNLPLDTILNEWTAMFVQKVDENFEKAYLTAKTNEKSRCLLIRFTVLI